MRHFSSTFRHNHLHLRRLLTPRTIPSASAHFKARKPPPPPPPPIPPKPPQRPATFTLHDHTWEDPYSWMSNPHDKVAMRHMDMYLEQEKKYTEAVLSDIARLRSKLQMEIASTMLNYLSTPAFRWGPWLYYRRVEREKQYHVLCRRLAAVHDGFISSKSPTGGFDFVTGQKIEQKLIDYNQEAERFGGYAYEGLSEVSPDHRYIAYAMYDKDNDFYKLCVRDMNLGVLCSKPQADRVSSVAWAKGGQALLYVVTDQNKRPYRLYCSIFGSKDEDVILLKDPGENVHVYVRQTKDFQFVTVNLSSTTYSKIYLINAADPLSGLTLVWECEAYAHCIIEHHQGHLYLCTNADRDGQSVDCHYLLRSPLHSFGPRKWKVSLGWLSNTRGGKLEGSDVLWKSQKSKPAPILYGLKRNVFLDDKQLIIKDVEFCNSHLVLVIQEGGRFRLCSVALPLKSSQDAVYLRELYPNFLPLPESVSQISPGTNYDFYSSIMRFTISSPVMPDAVVDYDLSNGKWEIIQQHDLLVERTRVLYGKKYIGMNTSVHNTEVNAENNKSWNDLSEFYACDQHEVISSDGVTVLLTVVYSLKKRKGQNPGLLHGHGAYGELLDKSWRSELKCLLDRGWVIAYADVRGGGGRGRRWHEDGRRTKKHNSVNDYISCAKFLIEKEIVHQNKLAGWGDSAGGLLVASAVNCCPDLFRAVVLKAPFLDPVNTLFKSILQFSHADYEEFGYPDNKEDFEAIRKLCPYENVQKGVLYPAALVSSSLDSRFGVWETAKWVARVRERTIYNPNHPILLNLTIDPELDSRYIHCRESALEAAFLLKTINS